MVLSYMAEISETAANQEWPFPAPLPFVSKLKPNVEVRTAKSVITWSYAKDKPIVKKKINVPYLRGGFMFILGLVYLQEYSGL